MHCLRRSRRRGRRSRGETLTSKQPSLRRRLLPVTAGMRACHVRTCCPVGHIMYILSACSHLTPGYDPINISSALSSPPYQRCCSMFSPINVCPPIFYYLLCHRNQLSESADFIIFKYSSCCHFVSMRQVNVVFKVCI